MVRIRAVPPPPFQSHWRSHLPMVKRHDHRQHFRFGGRNLFVTVQDSNGCEATGSIVVGVAADATPPTAIARHHRRR
ncbi:MAG: hypothetical protein IPM82_24560 [Saprospiraceae bacterium]|nr:hypothetical protein [Saprospiraceae bacterium]